MHVPKGWRVLQISEILERVSDPIFPEPDESFCQIGIRSHGKGIFHKEPVTGKQLGNKRVFRVQPDCLVVNIVFAWEQAVAKTSASEIGMIASHRFPMFRPKHNLCNIDYLTYFFKTPKGKYLLELASPGGAGRNKTLGQNEFASLAIKLPSVEEQQKIAQILSTWDKAIEKLEALLAAKQKRKKALMQRLLTGKMRFSGFKGEWKNVKIKDCAECLDNRRVPLNNEERLKRQGVIPYWGANGIVDYINEFIFDESIVLLAEDGGYFDEYSSRPIANISYGKSWVNNHAHVLRAKSNALNEWLYYSLVHKNILAFINSGTRAKLNNKAMLMIHILLPPIEEQQKIAAVLSTADKEIATHQNQLAALKQQKKALMQQLLTGKKRVKVGGMTIG